MSDSTKPLGPSTDQITDNSEVTTELLANTDISGLLADTPDTEVLNDTDICSLLGEQSIQSVVHHFAPLIKAVFHNLDLWKTWDIHSLADTLGISETDFKDMLAGKH